MITIGLSKIHVDCIIGCFAEERLEKRTIIIDVKLKTAFCNDDTLTATVDYGRVAEFVQTLAQSKEFHLLETLAECICSNIFENFSAVQELWLRVSKPQAHHLCDEAFVEIERKRE